MREKMEKQGDFKLDLMNWKQVLVITMALFGVVVAIGAFSGNIGVLGITIIIGIFLNITPQAIIVYSNYRKLKEM